MASWYNIRLLNDGNLINQLARNGNGYDAIGEAFAKFGAIDRSVKERKAKKQQQDFDNDIASGQLALSSSEFDQRKREHEYNKERNARIDEQAINEFKHIQAQDRIKNALEAQRIAQTGQYYNYISGGRNMADYGADIQEPAPRLTGAQLQTALDMGLAHINDDGAIVMNNGANAKKTKKNTKKPVTKGIDWNAGF